MGKRFVPPAPSTPVETLAVLGVLPVSVAVYGTPEDMLNVGANVNPDTIRCSPPEDEPANGLQIAFATKRWRISKLDRPCSSDRSNGFSTLLDDVNVCELCPLSVARASV